MIVEWFLELWAGMMEWFAGLLPQGEAPDFLAGVGPAIEQIVNSAAGLGAWVPWSWLGIVGGTVLLMWVVLVVVKGVRWLYGLTPFSGGS